ncbi:hypothetical protein C5167_032742 [Papaver somniferum]|uniref:Xylanase inhibitor C-terminal domain-containing protein n=1 Tax=Papaver somniferum TaxID=3469 RepID=A0A4Y7K8T9_PAPSO|nr:hypothetical protein C5167_032742 [Papaver somniferum]
MNVTMVPPVAPFGTCYKSSTLPDFVLEGDKVPPGVAFIFPKNELRTGEMTWTGGDVTCLAFVDGGSRFGYIQPIFP